ncbi:MAG: cell division protein BolA [Gammaproteobacteria bacterium]|jgi:BolA protein|nr:cell division protein BolA [Gammaproteobacteria bacterium]
MSEIINRLALIEQKLQAVFSPTELEVKDDSYLHIGHEGAKQGGGHYTVRIVSVSFMGKSLLERHRMIYKALAELMLKDIHALKIFAYPA